MAYRPVTCGSLKDSPSGERIELNLSLIHISMCIRDRGSTITQQLAKQFYSHTADTVMERLLQKPIEWVIAVQLERYYTKEEILTMYLRFFLIS